MDLEIYSPRLLSVGVSDSIEAFERDGYLARADLPRHSFRLPFDWNANPFKDRNWLYLVSSWRVMDPYIEEWFRTKDDALLARMQDIAVDWVNYQRSREPKTYTWYDMATGIRATRLAFLLDQAEHGRLAPRPELIGTAAEHLSRLMDDDAIAFNNHGIFQMAGLLALSKWASNPDAAQEFAKRWIERLLDDAFTEDGISKEHSTFYHRFTYQAFAKFRPVFRGIPKIEDTIRLAAANEPWLTMPDGKMAATGDTDNNTPGKPLEKVAPKDIYNLPSGRVAAKLWAQGGVAVCRSLPEAGRSFGFLMTAAIFSKAHKHADDLSFVYQVGTEPIFVDPGKYAYEYTTVRERFVSAAMHNTVSIQDLDLPIDLIAGSGSFLKSMSVRDDSIRFNGAITRPGYFTHAREICISGHGALDISDSIRGPNEHPYVTSLHVHPANEVEIFGEKAVIRTPSGQEVNIQSEDEIVLQDGLFSPGYGLKQPSKILTSTKRGKIVSFRWRIG